MNDLLQKRAKGYATRLLTFKDLESARQYIHDDIEKYNDNDLTAEGLNHIEICRKALELINQQGDGDE